jgi:hypothetical protein
MNCKPFFPGFPSFGTDSDSHMVACQAQQVRQESSASVVGSVRHDLNIAAVEAELDRVIEQIGSRMVQAMRDGDPQGAEILRDRLYAAIGSRSPEHQRRLQDRAWQRMLDADPCFFSAMGELDAKA